MENNVVTKQVIDRIERRIKQLDPVNTPTLKVIAAPVSPDHPMIQPSGIYDLYGGWRGAKRVDGGVCIFTEPSDDDLDKSIDLYTELNEYGAVYYRRHLYEDSGIPYFIYNIYSLLKDATKLYKACEASANIRVHASVNNVFKEKLAHDLGTGISSIHLPSELTCYDSEVCVSTTETYASTDFDNAEHRKTILEELTMPLLWAFNVPIGNDVIVRGVRDLISKNVGN